MGCCTEKTSRLLHRTLSITAGFVAYVKNTSLFIPDKAFSVPHDFERLQGVWPDVRRFDCARVIWCRKDESTMHVSLTGQVLDDCLFVPRVSARENPAGGALSAVTILCETQ
ncbi:MAG: hypothetical protein LAO06_05775 [Acidobacteriia bacterium]|nr:hypothetical protein [Terriglobia bacterium]